jgi:hypothetical protein
MIILDTISWKKPYIHTEFFRIICDSVDTWSRSSIGNVHQGGANSPSAQAQCPYSRGTHHNIW